MIGQKLMCDLENSFYPREDGRIFFAQSTDYLSPLQIM